MKATTVHSLIVVGVLSSFTSAWPVIRSPIDLVRRAPQSYSVVAVDGGSAATAPASLSTKTITDATTQIQTSLVLTTIVATPTDSSPVTSIVQTVTLATTIVETPTSATPVTVTVSPTSSAYDNGQWHTTYYFKTTTVSATTVSVATVSAANANANDVAPTPTTTTSIDPAQWAAWSGKGNDGLYSTAST